MAPFTIWEKNNNIKKAFKIMKAIDKVGGKRRRLLWGGNEGCGSEMVFKWVDWVQFWQNEGFFYCRVNELMVRSTIEAFAIKVTFPIRAGQYMG